MSVTCYNPLPQEVKNLSDILLKNKRYKDSLSISKETIRQLIAMYGHEKGFQNHQDYKNDIDDFVNYANDKLGFNNQYSEEQIKQLNSIIKKHPWITSPMSKHLANTVKGIFEKQNIDFSIIPLTNNKYIVNIPNIELDEAFKKQDSNEKRILYNYQGASREYIIKGNHIFNNKGVEVFKTDSVDRNRIFANLAVSEGRAVVVEHPKTKNKYVVNKKNEIISVTTGKKMQWGIENGDRRVILQEANLKFQQLEQGSNTTMSQEFYSGAAPGSDSFWREEAKSIGLKVKDYTGSDYRALSQEQRNIVEEEYKNARAFLGKPVLPIKNINSDYDPGVLTRRDMMQADSADAIFAIAERVVKPGDVEFSNGKKYPNNTGHDNVQGGTANAVARGIIRGIPVYVFDQSDNQWKVWNSNTKSFINTIEPKLTPKAATIGTRGINDSGKQAIKSILNNTFVKPLESNTKSIITVPTQTPTITDQQSIPEINSVIENSEREYQAQLNYDKLLKAEESFQAKKSDNFEKNHQYEIQVNGKWEKANTTPSTFVKDPSIDLTTSLEGEVLSLNPALALGNTFDQITRDFFEGTKKAYYPNISKVDVTKLHNQLGMLKKAVLSKYPEAKFVTREIIMSGIIEYNFNGEIHKKFIAGVPDMIIVTADGYFIVDMKTAGQALASDAKKEILSNYGSQIELYKKLLESKTGKDTVLGTYVLEARVQNFTFNNIKWQQDSLGNLYYTDKNNKYYLKNREDLISVVEQEQQDMGLGISWFLQVSPNQRTNDARIILNTEDQQALEELCQDFGFNAEKVTNIEEIEQSNEIAPFTEFEQVQIGRNIIKLLSLYVTRLSTDDYFREEFGLDSYEQDYFTKMTSTQIFQREFHNIKDSLVEYIKEAYFQEDYTVEDDSITWIRDNIENLIQMSFAEFMDVEGIPLVYEEDEEGDFQYGVDSIEVDYMESLPKVFKRRLATLGKYEMDYSGNILYTEDGYPIFSLDARTGLPEFYDKKEIIPILFELLHDKPSYNSMIETLENSQLPWAQQVLNILNEDEQIRKVFFRTLRTNQNNFLKIKGRKTYLLNNENVVQDLRTQFLTFLNSEEFSKNSIIVPKGNNTFKINVERLTRAKQKKLSTKDDVEQLLIYLGLPRVTISEHVVPQVIDKTTILLQKLERLKPNSNDVFNFYDNKVKKVMYSYFKSLASFIGRENALTAYDAGKTYSVYSPVSFIQNTVVKIKNGELDNPQSIYNKYPMFVNNGKHVGSWLHTLKTSKGASQVLRHNTITSVEKVPYIKMSTLKYLSSMIGDYFAPISESLYVEAQTNQESIRHFRMPTLSDKPAQESIRFFGKTLQLTDIEKQDKQAIGNAISKMKKTLTEEAYEFFLYELKRSFQVYNQFKNGDPKNDIAAFHINRKKANPKYEEKVTYSDIVNDPVLKESGLSFRYMAMFNDLLNINDAEVKDHIKVMIKNINNVLQGKSIDNIDVQDSFNALFNYFMDSYFKQFTKDIEGYVRKDSKFLECLGTETTKLEDPYNKALLEEFFWNDYIGTCNILNITIGDPAFYSHTIDLQKRFAQAHSSTSKADTSIEFTTSSGNVKRLSDGKHRMVIIDDLYMDSSLGKEAAKMFDEIAFNTEDKKIRKIMRDLSSTVQKFYDGIATTDGQAFSSPTGAWKKYMMLGETKAEEFRTVLDEIRKGNYSALSKWQDQNLQPFKPFAYSLIDKTFKVGNKTYSYAVPTQVKDSESMLLAAAVLESKGIKSPIAEIFRFLEDSHYKDDQHNDDTYKDNGIDIIVFKSAVKCGAVNSIDIDLTANKEGMYNVYDKLKELCYDKQGNYTEYVKEMPFEDWGQQQVIPHHFFDDEVDLGSQVRILPVSDVVGNLNENDEPIKVGNVEYTKEQFLEHYFTVLQQDFESNIYEIEEELFDDSMLNKKNLSAVLTESIQKDSKQTINLLKSVQVDNKGEFKAQLGDPSISDKIYSTVASHIKNNVNKQKFSGGSLVLSTGVGFQNDVHVRDSKGNILGSKKFNPKNGITMDCRVVPPNKEVYNKIIFNEKKHGKKLKNHNYKNGDIMSVSDIKKLGILTDEDLRIIGYRIPTEDNYSVFRMNIVEFLPLTSGEQIQVPIEAIALSGMDYDIDKLYCLYPRQNKFEDTTLKDELFECLWGVLAHPNAVEKQLNPGNFEELKDIAKTLDTQNLKNANICDIRTQCKLHKDNSAGKQFVGIGALNNISHAISNMGKLSFTNTAFIPFTINGINSSTMIEDDIILCDRMYSVFDGSRISRTLGMFVGAAADNAKEAVLGKLNITPVTANLAMAMLRLGIPVKTVSYILNMPNIKRITEENSSFSLNEAIRQEVSELSMQDKRNILQQVNFTNESLYECIVGKASESQQTIMEQAAIVLLDNMINIANVYSSINTYTSLNSTKNAVGPKAFDVFKKMLILDNMENTLEGGLLDGESLKTFKQRISFLQPLRYCYSDLFPNICKEWSPIFKQDFISSFTSILREFDININQIDEKFFKKFLDQFLIFKMSEGLGTKNIDIINTLPSEIDKAKKDIRFKHNMFIQYLNIFEAGKNDSFKTLSLNVINLDRVDRDNITASWEDLYNSDYRDLAVKIAQYFISKNGFSWHPNSPLSLAPVPVKTLLENYNSIFTKEITDTEILLRFKDQFIRNNKNFEDRISFIDFSNFLNNGLQKTSQGYYYMDNNQFYSIYNSNNINYVEINGTHYKVFKTTGVVLFEEVKSLGKKGILYEYCKNFDLKESKIDIQLQESLFEETSMEEDLNQEGDISQKKAFIGNDDSNNDSNIDYTTGIPEDLAEEFNEIINITCK